VGVERLSQQPKERKNQMIHLFKPAAESTFRVAVKAVTNPANVRVMAQNASQAAAWVGGVLLIPVALKAGDAIVHGAPKVLGGVKTAWGTVKGTAQAATFLAKAKFGKSE
jgi:hypothetical protein